MKKMLNSAITKTVLVFLAIGTAGYFLFRYFRGSNGNGIITGNFATSPKKDETPGKYNNLLDKNVKVVFNQDVILKGVNGRQKTVKKGEPITGSLVPELMTGGGPHVITEYLLSMKETPLVLDDFSTKYDTFEYYKLENSTIESIVTV